MEQTWRMQYPLDVDKYPVYLCAGHLDVAKDRGVAAVIDLFPSTRPCKGCQYELQMQDRGKHVLWRP